MASPTGTINPPRRKPAAAHPVAPPSSRRRRHRSSTPLDHPAPAPGARRVRERNEINCCTATFTALKSKHERTAGSPPATPDSAPAAVSPSRRPPSRSPLSAVSVRHRGCGADQSAARSSGCPTATTHCCSTPTPSPRSPGTTGIGVGGVSSQFADSSKRVTPAACVALYQPGEAQAYPHATNVTTVVMSDANRRSGQLISSSRASSATPTSPAPQLGRRRPSPRRLVPVCGDGPHCEEPLGQEQELDGRAARRRPTATRLRVATNLGPGGVVRTCADHSVRPIIVDVMSCAVGGGDPAGQARTIAAKIRDHVAERDG